MSSVACYIWRLEIVFRGSSRNYISYGWYEVIDIFMHTSLQMYDYPTWDGIVGWCPIHVIFVCIVPRRGTHLITMMDGGVHHYRPCDNQVIYETSL